MTKEQLYAGFQLAKMRDDAFSTEETQAALSEAQAALEESEATEVVVETEPKVGKKKVS